MFLQQASYTPSFRGLGLKNKIELDTGDSAPEETLAELIKQFDPYFSHSDRVSMLVMRSKDKGDWL